MSTARSRVRCLFPEPPPPGSVPSCAEGGVLGVLPGIIAMIQATEAVKLLTGIGEPLVGRLLLYDALAMEFNEFKLKKDPDCPICGEAPTIHELIDYEGFCGFEPQSESVAPCAQVRAVELDARMRGGESLLLLDVRETDELLKASIPGATHIPLGDLKQRASEIGAWKDRSVVVMCRTGRRSEKACEVLAGEGFAQLENLDGGIDAWSLTVDDRVPRY